MMARERILVIEDEPDIADLLQYNLEKDGFQVAVAHRGDSGLEAVRRESPDLILLDLMLPGLDGLELTRLLKRERNAAHVPIVMLTARGEEVDRIVGLELGADDYISKPVRVDQLLKALERSPARKQTNVSESPVITDEAIVFDKATQADADGDADVAEQLAQRSTALLTRGEGIVGERLDDVQLVAAVLAAIFVRGHAVLRAVSTRAWRVPG